MLPAGEARYSPGVAREVLRTNTVAIAADKYISRFKEMERNGSSATAVDEALKASHVSAGGYT